MCNESNANKVKYLIDRAMAASKPDDAMKFAQAALNAANALLAMEEERELAAQRRYT